MKLAVRIGLVVGVCVAAVLLTACSTTEGLGKDIEKAGKGLKDSAERNGAG